MSVHSEFQRIATDTISFLETTAGETLSQKIYDLPQGLLLSLPIADYYAFHSGRIEGTGVTPDVRADAESAMAIALERARR